MLVVCSDTVCGCGAGAVGDVSEKEEEKVDDVGSVVISSQDVAGVACTQAQQK